MKLLTAFITANNHPFAFVDQMFLKPLFASLNKDFHVPSASTMKRKVIRSYANCKLIIASILNAEGNGKNLYGNIIINYFQNLSQLFRQTFSYNGHLEIHQPLRNNDHDC